MLFSVELLGPLTINKIVLSQFYVDIKPVGPLSQQVEGRESSPVSAQSVCPIKNDLPSEG